MFNYDSFFCTLKTTTICLNLCVCVENFSAGTVAAHDTQNTTIFCATDNDNTVPF